MSLKLIYVCDLLYCASWVHAISVGFGSVSFAASGRVRNRWLGRTCVTGIFFCWVQWSWMKVDQFRYWFTYLQKICCVQAVCLNWYGTDDSFVGESSWLDWELLLGAIFTFIGVNNNLPNWTVDRWSKIFLALWITVAFFSSLNTDYWAEVHHSCIPCLIKNLK